MLIKAFFIEMKRKEINDYPDCMINCLYSLLLNEKLLNLIIVILYNKSK